MRGAERFSRIINTEYDVPLQATRSRDLVKAQQYPVAALLFITICLLFIKTVEYIMQDESRRRGLKNFQSGFKGYSNSCQPLQFHSSQDGVPPEAYFCSNSSCSTKTQKVFALLVDSYAACNSFNHEPSLDQPPTIHLLQICCPWGLVLGRTGRRKQPRL